MNAQTPALSCADEDRITAERVKIRHEFLSREIEDNQSRVHVNGSKSIAWLVATAAIAVVADGFELLPATLVGSQQFAVGVVLGMAAMKCVCHVQKMHFHRKLAGKLACKLRKSS